VFQTQDNRAIALTRQQMFRAQQTRVLNLTQVPGTCIPIHQMKCSGGLQLQSTQQGRPSLCSSRFHQCKCRCCSRPGWSYLPACKCHRYDGKSKRWVLRMF